MSSLTIRNICDKAGISTGSFYNLFEGKDDLVSYYLRDVFIAYKQKAEEEPQGVLRLRRSSSSIASISIASLKRDSNSSLASIQP